MAWSVLVTASIYWGTASEAREALEQAGCTIVRPDTFRPNREGLVRYLQGCQAVVAGVEPYDAALFAACPDLRLISRCGVGYDAVNTRDATQHGVMLTNTPGAMVEAVADLAFAFILAGARRLLEMDRAVRDCRWSDFNGSLVYGKTLGLIGAGLIGTAVARRAAGFGMRVLVADPACAALPPGAELVDLADLLAQSDFVSLHAPAIPETEGMMGRREFAMMKPGSIFVNTARGSLVDEEALAEALVDGHLAAAGVDAYREEPLPASSALLSAPNLILSPHQGFNARECAARMGMMAAESVLRIMAGEPPRYVVNQDVLASPALRLARG